MRKLKVLTVVGTRPEIIRLSRVISELDKNCNHTLVHTGQNFDYELNQIFFEELGVREPDFFLNSAQNSKNVSETIGKLIMAVDTVFEEIEPDAILVLGDTNSCLSVIPAKRRKIPIFHMEAGNRCFDFRVPEEINRRIVDHTSDMNLTYSEIARQYLINEGLSPDLIIKTGSPMKEVINFYFDEIQKSNILLRKKLTKNNYFLVSIHREENVENEKNFNKIIHCLNSLARDYKLPILISAHPRIKNKIKKKELEFNELINFHKPLGFFDYLNLQMHAKIVISDSGTINEEASILNFPAINMRENHERPEAMERASTLMCGLNYERLLQCIHLLEQNGKEDKIFKIIDDYSEDYVSKKVVRIIHGYVDYINKVIWKK